MKTYTLSAPRVIQQLEEVAKTTNLSPSKIIEIALINLLDDDNNFIDCPNCRDHLAIRGTMSGERQIEIFPCGCCGKVVTYDTDHL
jgi:hypothetical protein